MIYFIYFSFNFLRRFGSKKGGKSGGHVSIAMNSNSSNSSNASTRSSGNHKFDMDFFNLQ